MSYTPSFIQVPTRMEYWLRHFALQASKTHTYLNHTALTFTHLRLKTKYFKMSLES